MNIPKRKNNFYNLNEFYFLEKIGEGGFSSVYKAVNKINNKLFAIKIIDLIEEKENLTIIENELKILDLINHENLITYYDYFIENNKLYLILEFIKDGNLFNYLNKNHPLNKKLIMKIYLEILKGLKYLHDKGFVYRDIKPENILIKFENDNVIPIITDFGWCCHILDSNFKNEIAGTYVYMSPEIFFGKAQTKKTDIWSMGILLYELFHNKEPIQGNSQNEVKNKILELSENSVSTKSSLLNISMPNIQNQNIRNLISQMLLIDPNARLDINEIILKTRNIIYEFENNKNFNFNSIIRSNKKRTLTNFNQTLKKNNYFNKSIDSSYHFEEINSFKNTKIIRKRVISYIFK